MKTTKANRLPDVEPAASIIRKLGGTGTVTKITGLHRSVVHRWRRPAEVRGADGMIPLRHVSKLMAYAAENGIEISAEEFIPPPK